MTDESETQSVAASLAIILVARTALNASYRIIYPFLPSLAAGLGISLPAASALVTLRQVSGLSAPFLGPLAEQRGRRQVMVVALALFILASLLLAGVGLLWAAAVAFILYGLAKVLYDPAMHSYLGDTVPYRQRGRAIGVSELAWSGAWLIGVPAAGFLIVRWGWRAPWAVLVGLGALGLILTRVALPPGHHSAEGVTTAPRQAAAAVLAAWRDLLRRPRVRALLLVSLLFTVANELPFIAYGAWLADSFHLSVSSVGLASIVVGVAEALAELGTTVITDRLGKRRSIVAGLLGVAASLAALPLLAGLGLAGALAGVALMMLTFEFGIVSLLPLATELVPESRASYLSLTMTAFSLGRIAGAVSGGWLWAQTQAITPSAATGAACALLAALLVVKIVPEIG